MDKKEINTVSRLLSKIESSEGEHFKEALQENAVVHCELFPNNGGAFVVCKEDDEYLGLCYFKEVLSDYDTARSIERTVTKFLKELKPGEIFCFTHDGKQLFLNNFVCKLNFEKPHYGTEYKLKCNDFAYMGECDMRGLEARPYDYAQPDAMFNIHQRAFCEQNTRAERPEGYDEDDIAYIKKRFSKPDDSKSIYTYYLDGKLIGYTLFMGGYCDIMALDPDYQGHGYGRAMFVYALNKAFADTKVRSVSLHTFFINAKAQKLYESLGFKRVSFFCTNDSKPLDKLCFMLV